MVTNRRTAGTSYAAATTRTRSTPPRCAGCSSPDLGSSPLRRGLVVSITRCASRWQTGSPLRVATTAFEHLADSVWRSMMAADHPAGIVREPVDEQTLDLNNTNGSPHPVVRSPRDGLRPDGGRPRDLL